MSGDTAARILADDQRGGDPRQMATAYADLAKSLTAASKASLACGRLCQVLSAEGRTDCR